MSLVHPLMFRVELGAAAFVVLVLVAALLVCSVLDVLCPPVLGELTCCCRPSLRYATTPPPAAAARTRSAAAVTQIFFLRDQPAAADTAGSDSKDSLRACRLPDADTSGCSSSLPKSNDVSESAGEALAPKTLKEGAGEPPRCWYGMFPSSDGACDTER